MVNFSSPKGNFEVRVLVPPPDQELVTCLINFLIWKEYPICLILLCLLSKERQVK